MTQYRLFLFGAPRLERNGRPIEIKLRKAWALLAYLAVTGKAQRRTDLALMLWPESDSAGARASLRRTLYRLSKIVGEELIAAESETLALHPDHDLWCDVRGFKAAMADCLPMGRLRDGLSDDCWRQLKEAMGLFTDEFLGDFSVSGCPELEEWRFFESTDLANSLALVIEQLAWVHLARNELERALTLAQQLVTQDPLNEHAHRLVMEIYSRLGEDDAAIRQYQRCAEALVAELGIDPAPETHALFQQIQAGTLQRPAAEKSVDHTFTPQPQQQLCILPEDDTPFVGRSQELERLCTIVMNPDCRLVTVIGLGGMGKTRLATAAGRALCQSMEDGVVFVSLVGVEESEDVASAIAQSLGISLTGQVAPLTEVANYLHSQRLLLILDNFEQLAGDTWVVAQLLETAPKLKLLLTSREPLRLQTEWRFDLEGLGFPNTEAEFGDDTSAQIAFDAVNLFIETARRVAPGFRLTPENQPHVYTLCRRVAGVPLALKLAATWLRVMPCAQIVAEIDRNMDILHSKMHDIPPRQQSMRAIFDYTWNLLRPQEQLGFQALSIFRGGFTQAAASSVAAVSLPLLYELMDHNLVTMGADMRYEIHELTRQFGAEKLSQSGQQPLLELRHSTYYLELTIQKEQEWVGRQAAQVAEEMGKELDNIRHAWRLALHQGNAELVELTVSGVALMYERLGLLVEGEHMMEMGLERFATGVEGRYDIVQALLALRYAYSVHERGNTATQDAAIQRAMQWVDRLSSPEQMGDIYYLRAAHALGEGNLETAYDLLEKAAQSHQAANQNWQTINTYNFLGYIYSQQNRPTEAMQSLELAMELSLKRGNLRGEALTLSNQGVAHYMAESYELAEICFERALRLFKELGDTLAWARTTSNLGATYVERGRYQQALPCLEQVIPIFKRAKIQAHLFSALDSLNLLLLDTGQLERAAVSIGEQLHLAVELQDRYNEAWARRNTARLDAEMGRFDPATRQLREADLLMRQTGDPLDQAQIQASYGLLFQYQGQKESALAAYQRAVEMFTQIGHQLHRAHAENHMATLYIEFNRLAEAQHYNQSALTMAQKLQHRALLFQARLTQAHLTHLSGDREHARQELAQLLAEADNPAEEAAVHYLLWQLEDVQNQGLSALDAYRRLSAQTPGIRYRQRMRELQTFQN